MSTDTFEALFGWIMKIAIAQINPIIGDFEYNFDRIKDFSEKAVALSCDLVVFPELVVSGYPPRDLLERNDFIEANLACLNRLVDSIRGIGIICGFVEKNPPGKGKSLYNAAVLFEDGKIVHRAFKRLLPTYDVFDERRYFEPGIECEPFSYKGHSLGLAICEDVWNDKDIFQKRIYSIDPVSLMVEKGADLIINISASPFYMGKEVFRQEMLRSIARKYCVPLVFANQVGGNDGLLFDGISTAFNRLGNIAVRAREFEEDLVVFDSESPVSTEDNSQAVLRTGATMVLKALVVGTHDYAIKCGFSKAILGLSGGIDSALTAAIASLALGRKNVLAVFMPSRYTSKDNYQDTKKLADNLGIDLIQIPIDGMFKEFLRFLSPSFKTGEPGVTEQNIQARIRATILMGFSNRDGLLLLSTGNKSEASVGYCTLYGDMSGGLAVISDVPKTMVYKLSGLVNAEKEWIPKRIIEKAPSAELKPNQKDQDDLPPYEILDAVLKGYIEDLKSPDELVQMGFDKKLMENVISKVVRSEYKRQQAAPGLKVTSKAFGYGRRYPIAQRYMAEST
jgi:NAD+ synthetase|tara:strand:- start:44276 stop:45970 length:1695 start_codon:yes stop_codon:yes gene_type:complete